MLSRPCRSFCCHTLGGTTASPTKLFLSSEKQLQVFKESSVHQSLTRYPPQLLCPLLGILLSLLWRSLWCSSGQRISLIWEQTADAGKRCLPLVQSMHFLFTESTMLKCKWASGCWLLPILSLLCCAVVCLGLNIGIFRRKLFESILLDRYFFF